MPGTRSTRRGSVRLSRLTGRALQCGQRRQGRHTRSPSAKWGRRARARAPRARRLSIRALRWALSVRLYHCNVLFLRELKRSCTPRARAQFLKLIIDYRSRNFRGFRPRRPRPARAAGAGRARPGAGRPAESAAPRIRPASASCQFRSNRGAPEWRGAREKRGKYQPPRCCSFVCVTTHFSTPCLRFDPESPARMWHGPRGGCLVLH